LIADIPPYGMALIAAFLFAFGGQLQNLGLQNVDSRTGTMLSIGSSTAIYWLAAPFLLHPQYFLHPAVLIFVAIGFVRPAVSANLSVAAIRHLGPTLTATLNATGPFFGSAFGILILGELLTWQIALGTFGIIFAVLILSLRSKKIPTTWPMWALGLPVAAAIIRACANGFAKIGMNYIPDAYFIGVVTFTVSFLLTTGLHIAKGGGRPKIALGQRGPMWFIVSGAFFGFAALSVNFALLHGSIVTVVPIIAASPVFSMLLSIILFKREQLNLKIVLAVLIVVASVILIALGK